MADATPKLPPPCEICDTPDECLAGKWPCSLCGEFIADVPRSVANEMVRAFHAETAHQRSILRRNPNAVIGVDVATTPDITVLTVQTPPTAHPFDKRMLMRELLEIMFRGWILYEQSYEHVTESTMRPTRSQEDAMIEAADGNAVLGELLSLFGHWSNDIENLAAHYGLALARRQADGKLLHADGTMDTLMKGGNLEIVYIDPAPTPQHYWHNGQWQPPELPGLDMPVEGAPQ